METTSTPKGAILHGLLKDKTGVGFSMRGLAELERLTDHNVGLSKIDCHIPLLCERHA